MDLPGCDIRGDEADPDLGAGLQFSGAAAVTAGSAIWMVPEPPLVPLPFPFPLPVSVAVFHFWPALTRRSPRIELLPMWLISSAASTVSRASRSIRAASWSEYAMISGSEGSAFPRPGRHRPAVAQGLADDQDKPVHEAAQRRGGVGVRRADG
jgi:hypothetical protein